MPFAQKKIAYLCPLINKSAPSLDFLGVNRNTGNDRRIYIPVLLVLYVAIFGEKIFKLVNLALELTVYVLAIELSISCNSVSVGFICPSSISVSILAASSFSSLLYRRIRSA